MDNKYNAHIWEESCSIKIPVHSINNLDIIHSQSKNKFFYERTHASGTHFFNAHVPFVQFEFCWLRNGRNSWVHHRFEDLKGHIMCSVYRIFLIYSYFHDENMFWRSTACKARFGGFSVEDSFKESVIIELNCWDNGSGY